MVRDLEAGLPRNACIELTIDWFVQVKDPPALLTSEVVVVLLIAFVSADGAAEIQFRDQPIFAQHLQIAIDCSLTDVRNLFPDLVIYPVSSRMRIRMPEYSKNRQSLFGVSCCHNQ